MKTKRERIPPRSGIYEIVNTINGKRYVGSAQDIDARWKVHTHFLKKNNHHSPRLQNAWNKYGEASFQILDLELCEKSRLYEVEQAYIDTLSPEYNMTFIAESPRGARACHRPDWTPEMDAILIARYRQEGSALAAEIGVSPRAVSHRATRLGIPCEVRRAGRKKTRVYKEPANKYHAQIMKDWWRDNSGDLRKSRHSQEFRERMRAVSLVREGNRKNTVPWRDEATLRRLYIDEGVAAIEIGRRLGCSGTSITKWLLAFGITRQGSEQVK